MRWIFIQFMRAYLANEVGEILLLEMQNIWYAIDEILSCSADLVYVRIMNIIYVLSLLL